MAGPEDDPEYAEKIHRVMQEIRQSEDADGTLTVHISLEMPADEWEKLKANERRGIKHQLFGAYYLIAGSVLATCSTLAYHAWGLGAFAVILAVMGYFAVRAGHERLRRYSHIARIAPTNGVPAELFESLTQKAADDLSCPDPECDGIGFDVTFHAGHMHFRCRKCNATGYIEKPPGVE